MNNCYDLGPLCKLRDWIPIEKLDWSQLSLNPNAIHLLEKNITKIFWEWCKKIYVICKNNKDNFTNQLNENTCYS